MRAAPLDLLAGWRAARAAGLVPGVPGVAAPPGTLPDPRKTTTVPGVPGVPGGNEECCTRGAPADPTEVRVALYARLQAEAAAALAQREPDPIEAAERAAVFGDGGEARAYQPGEPDPLRDGLLRGWRDHRGLVWSPDGPIRGT